MTVYSRQLATAKRIIAKKGESVSILLSSVAQDQTKPWNTQTTGTTETAKMAFFSVGTQVEKSLMLAANKPYPVGSLLGYMAYAGYDVDLNSVFTRSSDNATLRPINIDILNVNGEKILYTVVFKQ